MSLILFVTNLSSFWSFTFFLVMSYLVWCYSVEEVVKIVVFCDIVAGVISLDILDESLEVEVWKLVHD